MYTIGTCDEQVYVHTITDILVTLAMYDTIYICPYFLGVAMYFFSYHLENKKDTP